MQLLDSDYFHGPNVHASRSAFWSVLDLGPLAAVDWHELGDGFTRTLPGLLPGLAALMESARGAGEALSLERIFPATMLELQRLAGFDAGWSQVLPQGVPGRFTVLVECPAHLAAPFFANFTLFLLNQLLPAPLRNPGLPAGEGIDLQHEFAHFLSVVRPWSLDAPGNALLAEATRRGIPWLRLGLASRLVQLGHAGRAQRVQGTLADTDGVVAGQIVRDRSVTRELLLAAGLPVPACYRVTALHEAMAAGRELGYPVMLESAFADGDDAVPVVSEADLAAAAPARLAGDGAMLVSRPPEGRLHRLLTVGGRLRAATVAGNAPADCSDELHPDNRELAETAAAQFRLSACEILFVTPAIDRSWRDGDGLISGLHYPADFAFHPRAREEGDLAGPFLDALFPGGDAGRIPVAAVTGSNGKTTTVQMLYHILRHTGRVCAAATTQGIFVDGKRTDGNDRAGSLVNEIFLDPRVEVAVLETARRGLLRNGLAVGHCDVGAVLNVTGDHVGTDGIRDLDDLARIKRLLAEHTRDTLVLNADDPRCLAMAPHTPAAHICLVTAEAANPAFAAHLAAGGRGVRLAGEPGARRIELHDGPRLTPVLATSEIPATFGDRADANAINAAFAAAMAWHMGVDAGQIADALRRFAGDHAANPGRLNLLDDLPFRVIVDFAHNPAKYAALADFVGRLDTAGRRILLVTSPGRRPEAHFRAIAEVCSRGFDHFVLAAWDDDYSRGDHGDFGIQNLIRDALLRAGVAENAIRICRDETAAIDAALALARAGDSVTLCVKDHARCMAKLAARREERE